MQPGESGLGDESAVFVQRPPGGPGQGGAVFPTEVARDLLGEKAGGGRGVENLGLWGMELESEPTTAFPPHPRHCQLPQRSAARSLSPSPRAGLGPSSTDCFSLSLFPHLNKAKTKTNLSVPRTTEFLEGRHLAQGVVFPGLCCTACRS